MSRAIPVGLIVVGVLVLGGCSLPVAPVQTVAPSSAPTTAAPSPASSSDDPWPTNDESPSFVPQKSDWRVGVKVTERHCFGSAGCNVTVRIDPQYVGTQELPSTGTIEVTYEISGDSSGPVVGTFTVENSQASYDKETDMDTASAHTKIKARVTDVSYG